jgi:hypothetical protein
MLVAGLVIALGGLVCLTIGLVRLVPSLGASWHLHEQGVRSLRRGQELALSYDDVDELTVNVARVFFHGVCTGEVREVTLRSQVPDKPAIHFRQVRRPGRASETGHDEPDQVRRFCDRIAASIAGRMAARVERGEATPWVGGLRILSNGLELDLPLGGTDRMEWKEIERVGIENGEFRLWAYGGSEPLIKLPTRLPSFFPGYVLLSRHLKPRRDVCDGNDGDERANGRKHARNVPCARPATDRCAISRANLEWLQPTELERHSRVLSAPGGPGDGFREIRSGHTEGRRHPRDAWKQATPRPAPALYGLKLRRTLSGTTFVPETCGWTPRGANGGVGRLPPGLRIDPISGQSRGQWWGNVPTRIIPPRTFPDLVRVHWRSCSSIS